MSAGRNRAPEQTSSCSAMFSAENFASVGIRSTGKAEEGRLKTSPAWNFQRVKQYRSFGCGNPGNLVGLEATEDDR